MSPILIIGIVFLVIFFLIAITPRQREYGIKMVTVKGEEVKSLAEKRITDYFSNNHINYVYEHEAKTRSFFFSERISHPDFYLPDYNVYIEYWGLVDAEDRRLRDEYVRNMKWKMAQYHRNNIKFISIYPSNLNNLDWIFRTKFKEVTGYELPS